MDTAPRTDWNGLPGYLAAERLSGDGEDATFNRLGIFSAKIAREFMEAPIGAIGRKLRDPRADVQKKGEEALAQFVLRFGAVMVMAERERVAEEKRSKGGR